MAGSYDFASKGTNNKVKDEYDDCDDWGKPTYDGYGYPYEDQGMSRPAVVVDGGQRKSSITRYPNVDGSDSYVVRTERVVKVVRPVITTENSLMENLDNRGMVKNFLDQFLKEASMSTTSVLSRPAPGLGTRTNWAIQDGAPSRPDWDGRPAWASRYDCPLRYVEHHEFGPPNMGTTPNYSSWEDSAPRYTEHHELSRPSAGTRHNWHSRDESPPRSVTRPQLNHPNSGARHDWPSQDDSPRRSLRHPNWSATPNWPRRYDSPPSRSMACPELNHHNLGARPNGPIRDDSPPRFLVHPQLSHPNSDATPNWPRQYDSPPRSMVLPELTYPTLGARPNWSSRYESPPRSTVHLDSGHSNSSARPNWSGQDDSPPRSKEHPLLSHPNSSIIPNWANQVESPPKSMTRPDLSHPNSNTKPNWSSQDNSPLRSKTNFELNYPNSSVNPNWHNGEHSLPRSTTHPEFSHPNSNTKPNWSNRDDSPPNSRKVPELSHSNSSVKPNWQSQNSSPPKSIVRSGFIGPNSSSTKPNWPSQEDSPDNVEKERDKINTNLAHKKFDGLNLQERRGTSPLPNKNASNERSGSDVGKAANYNGTTMGSTLKDDHSKQQNGVNNFPNEDNLKVKESGQRPNWPNRKGHVDNGTSSGISPYKSNKDDHEKPKSNGEQSKKIDDKEIPDINNQKIVTQREDSVPIRSTTHDLPKNIEDSYKKQNTDRLQDQDDDYKKSGILTSSTNVSNKAGNKKPNFGGGWYKHPNPPPISSTTNELSDIMKLVEEVKKTAAYPYEITPNPPQEVHYSLPAVPAAPWNYYRPVLDSNQAVKKYNGTLLPNTYQGKS